MVLRIPKGAPAGRPRDLRAIKGAARFAALLLNLAVLAVLPCLAQPSAPAYRDVAEIPDTPAYRHAQKLVALANANDPAAIAAYVTQNFTPEFLAIAPIEEHVRILQGFFQGSSGLEIHSARVYDPPRPESDAVLVVRNRLMESWQAVVVTAEEAPPYRIASANLLPARRPSDLPPAERLDDSAIVRDLGAYVDRLSAEGTFSGTLLLAKDGRVLLEKAAGIANRDFDVPVNLETKFNLGSMNKMITAVAVAQLAEQGKLSFEDPIGKYLDTTWVAQEILDRVTVHHLLTHTSGLGSYFNEVFERSSRLLFREVGDYKLLTRGETLAFAPGSAWGYSNTGFLLLGAIVEAASGENYFDYVRTHIYGPAGMEHSDSYELDQVNPNLAVGYERVWTGEGVTYRNNIFAHVLRGGPAGGGYSTVGDLWRFDQALRAGRLLAPASLERLWRADPEQNSPGYGYGFGVQTTPAGRLVGHSGGFTGISADLGMYLDAGYTMIVLSNDSEGAPPVYEKARELIELGR